MEERFVYRKPPIGKAKAAVILNGDIRVEHRLLTTPISISFDNVATAVRVAGVDDEQPLLRRDVRIFNLASAWTDVNVVMVFKSPVHVERFTINADLFLSISQRERWRGLDMDALGVRVEEPDGLVAALAHRGVPSLPTVAMALGEVVGYPTGAEAVELRDETTKRRTRNRLSGLCFGVLWTIVIALGLALGHDAGSVPTSTVVGVLASSLVWTALIAVLLFLTASGGDSGPVSNLVSEPRESRLFYLAKFAGLLMVSHVMAGGMASHLGTPRVLAHGLLASVPGGLLCGFVLRASRSSAAG